MRALLLVLALLGCRGDRPPAPPLDAYDCVTDCLRARQMEGRPIEAIAADCRHACAGDAR